MESKIILSEDIFENILSKRIEYLEFINSLKEEIEYNLLELNEGRKKLEMQYMQYKYNPVNYFSLEDLSISVETRNKTMLLL